MKKSEDYLNEIKKLWKSEPQKSSSWQLWYPTHAERLTVYVSCFTPVSGSNNAP